MKGDTGREHEYLFIIQGLNVNFSQTSGLKITPMQIVFQTKQ
ncbi:protein of unknown function [Xenorhabdus doucetiae]|uniref:Uncharacterized protein n=1 Tax=Xenorhabdus doucetiae TaxID=351671 RepID=A0A068QNW6_9GAMM|nr:protein of unknown function [Xenorhabdus doucetiae]